MNYYLGPWVWDTTPGSAPHWRAPLEAVGSIDLRSLVDCAGTVTPSGAGFFPVPDGQVLDASYRLFGNGDLRDIAPREADRSVFASMLGLATVSGDKLVDWLYTGLTLHSNPAGDVAVRPLMPTTTTHLEIWLGGHSLVKRVNFDLGMPEAQKCIAVMQQEYRLLRQRTLDGLTTDPRLYLKVLGSWGRKFRVSNPEDILVPLDLPKERAVAPTTTIQDTFNRPNADPLGTSSDGDWSWTEQSGDMDVSVGKCIANNVIVASSRAEKDLSSSDHYSQVDIEALFGGSYAGGAVRFDGAAQTYYQGVMYSGDGKFYVSKLVAGAETHLGTAVSITTNFPEAYKCLISGSTLKGYQAGVERRSETDTAIAAGTRTGISFYGSGTLDNFAAADLPGGVRAMVKLLDTAGVGGAGLQKFIYATTFFGDDVPEEIAKRQQIEVVVEIDNAFTMAELWDAIVAGVQAKALPLGLSIGASDVLELSGAS